jgi:hypothetical protein
MNFLRNVILEQGIDNTVVTAGDVSTYFKHVKHELKGEKITKATVASAVHDIIEDDPKFGSNPKIAKELINKVFDKFSVVTEGSDFSEVDWQHFRLSKFVEKYGTNKTASVIKSAYNNDKLSQATAKRLLDELSSFHPNNHKFVLESWDDEDEDEDPDVKIASKEAKKSGARLLSKKAEEALSKKLSKADTKAEDESVKKLEEQESMLDVDELSPADLRDKFLAATKRAYPKAKGLVVKSDGKELRCEVPGEDRCYSIMPLNTGKIEILGESWDDEDEDEDPDVKIASKEAKKVGTKLLSKKAEEALGKKLSKADTKSEDESVKKVIESSGALVRHLLAKYVVEAKNDMGDNTQRTYTGWKRAIKAKYPDVWFDGDADICNAMVGPKPYVRGETKGVGEWDGDCGTVYK